MRHKGQESIHSLPGPEPSSCKSPSGRGLSREWCGKPGVSSDQERDDQLPLKAVPLIGPDSGPPVCQPVESFQIH